MGGCLRRLKFGFSWAAEFAIFTRTLDSRFVHSSGKILFKLSSSMRDDSDSSDDSHYRRKQRKNKKHRKEDPTRLCATLTEKLLTTAYKSKTIRFKMDEDPLQLRTYFLTFIDLLDMIFSQYRETCEVLLDYPKIGGEDVIEDYEKIIYQEPFA